MFTIVSMGGIPIIFSNELDALPFDMVCRFDCDFCEENGPETGALEGKVAGGFVGLAGYGKFGFVEDGELPLAVLLVHHPGEQAFSHWVFRSVGGFRSDQLPIRIDGCNSRSDEPDMADGAGAMGVSKPKFHEVPEGILLICGWIAQCSLSRY